MSADENLGPQFVRREMKNERWQAKASYHVKVDGKFAGHVTQYQDTSKTGGSWTAHMRGRVVSSGHPTRRDAAQSVVSAYHEAGFGKKKT